eukprot:Nk52_evm2s288 gene=Nk52_evmTU2s288
MTTVVVSPSDSNELHMVSGNTNAVDVRASPTNSPDINAVGKSYSTVAETAENSGVAPYPETTEHVGTGSSRMASGKRSPNRDRKGNRALSVDNYIQGRPNRSFSEPDIVEDEILRGSKATNSGSEYSQEGEGNEEGETDGAERRLKDLKIKKRNTLSSSERKKKYETLKAAKKRYRKEQKQRTEKLTNTLTQSSTILISGWLKMRGPLKNWVSRWFVLRRGVLVYYKDPKDRDWLGTIFLHGCMVTERPSKKEGFCFKIFHLYQNQIYGSKGPKGETLSSAFIPIQTDYCILRAVDEREGKLWMKEIVNAINMMGTGVPDGDEIGDVESASHASCETLELKDEFERKVYDGNRSCSTPDFMAIGSIGDGMQLTTYVRNDDPQCTANDNEEEWAEESKGLLWSILKQVRPGMDLTRVVLPTFILEPRSFLQKLSDYNFYCELLENAIKEKDPQLRMVAIVKYYLAGFHIRPKGMKKPYNPILGETFRCRWDHDDGSFTHFVSEQVSHHPPISAFYCSNRKKGFTINGSIAPKSKFWGNSAGSILEGFATLYLIGAGEEYTIQFPTAYCKGIFVGTLTMEMGGPVTIECKQTGLKCEMEFKLKPMIGGSPDQIVGKIKSGKETVGYVNGCWALGGEIEYSDSKKGSKKGKGEILLKIDENFVKRRAPVDFVKFEEQGSFESEKLWKHVSDAIMQGDQVKATDEKKILEDSQREAAARLKEQGRKWETKLFEENADGTFVYRYFNIDPWDPAKDTVQQEMNGRIMYNNINGSEEDLTPEAATTLAEGIENSKKRMRGTPGSEKRRRSSVDFDDMASLLKDTKSALITHMDAVKNLSREVQELKKQAVSGLRFMDVLVIFIAFFSVHIVLKYMELPI